MLFSESFASIDSGQSLHDKKWSIDGVKSFFGRPAGGDSTGCKKRCLRPPQDTKYASLSRRLVASQSGAGSGPERHRHGRHGGGSAERPQPGAGRPAVPRAGEEGGDAAGEGRPLPGLCKLHAAPPAPPPLPRRKLTAVSRVFQVTTEEIYLAIPLVMENKVAQVQTASVSLYDYYEPRKRSSASFFLIAAVIAEKTPTFWVVLR